MSNLEGLSSIFFTFPSKEIRACILNDGPWHVFGDLLVLVEISDNSAMLNIKYENTRIWVRIHNLPLKGFTKAVVDVVGVFFNGVDDYELPELVDAYGNPLLQVSFKQFLRVKTSININEGLRRFTKLKITKDFGEFEEYQVRFSYEKLPDVCFCCGVLGHKYMNCKFYRNQKVEELFYGEWIKSENFYSKFNRSSTGSSPKRHEKFKQGLKHGFKSSLSENGSSSKESIPAAIKGKATLAIAAEPHRFETPQPSSAALQPTVQPPALLPTPQLVHLDQNLIYQLLAALQKPPGQPLNPTSFQTHGNGFSYPPVPQPSNPSWFERSEDPSLEASPSPLVGKNLFNFGSVFPSPDLSSSFLDATHSLGPFALSCPSSQGSSSVQPDPSSLKAIVSGEAAPFTLGSSKSQHHSSGVGKRKSTVRKSISASSSNGAPPLVASMEPDDDDMNIGSKKRKSSGPPKFISSLSNIEE